MDREKVESQPFSIAGNPCDLLERDREYLTCVIRHELYLSGLTGDPALVCVVTVLVVMPE